MSRIARPGSLNTKTSESLDEKLNIAYELLAARRDTELLLLTNFEVLIIIININDCLGNKGRRAICRLNISRKLITYTLQSWYQR